MSERLVPYQIGNVLHVGFPNHRFKVDGDPPPAYGNAVPVPPPEPVPLHRGKEGGGRHDDGHCRP